MNNNDILKARVREMKQSGNSFAASLSGSEIANAGRTQLADWLEAMGLDPAAVISAHRTMNPGQNPEAKQIERKPTQNDRSQPANPIPTGEAMSLMQKAISMLLPEQQSAPAAGLDAETFERLKNELLEELLAEVSPTIRVEISQAELPPRPVGRQHKTFPTLLALSAQRVDTFLVGPAGSFKTTGAEEVAKALELEFSAISVCQQTTAVALLGYLNAMGDYVTTEFRKRYEQGGVFLLDEMDNGNANVLAVLNSALANTSCAFPDGMIRKHPDFILIASGNTFGTGANAQFVGRCQLDAATLDRFAVLEWPYDEGMEMEISGNKEWCKRVQGIRASAARLGSKLVVSPRATLKGAKLLAAGMDVKAVEKMLIWKGIPETEKAKIITGI